MRLRTVPGIGEILALIILYEAHDIGRFPTVGDFVSYCRLVKCARESAGKRYGFSGKKIGNAHLKWAFSEAAVLFLRHNAAGQHFFRRLERKYGKPKGPRRSPSSRTRSLARSTSCSHARRPSTCTDSLTRERRGERVSPPSNWTAMGQAPRMLRVTLRPAATTAHIDTEQLRHVPGALPLDWPPVPARHPLLAIGSCAPNVLCPSPEPDANWTGVRARARRLESAGTRAQVSF